MTQALRNAASETRPQRVLVVDLMLPEMDGPALAEAILEHCPGIHVPFTSEELYQGVESLLGRLAGSRMERAETGDSRAG